MSFIKITDPRKREEMIKDFIETRKRIKDNFISQKVGEAEYQTGLTKLFKPVTDTQKATAKEITEAQKATAERIEKGLLPIKEGIESLTMLPIETGETIPAIKYTEKEKIELGDYAADGLQSTHGKKATQSDIIPVNVKEGIYKIGKTPFKIKKDDLYFDFDNFKGTSGLWKLLTSRDIPDKKKYTKEDLKDYIIIMYTTNATRQDFNKDKQRIGGNDKMNKLIKPLVKAVEEGGEDNLKLEINKYFGYEALKEDETDEKDETDEEDEYEEDKNGTALIGVDPQPGTSGTTTNGKGIKGKGLKFLPTDPNALIDRFDLLFSSKKAGHTGVKNEIVAILDELKRQKVINVKTYKKLNSLIKK